MLTNETKQALKAAYDAGQLRVKSVDPQTGAVGLKPCVAILQHTTPHKACVRIQVEGGAEAVFTVDHSVFYFTEQGVEPVAAGRLKCGDLIAYVEEGGSKVSGRKVATIKSLPPRQVTYDLSVPGPENFVLTNGILAHNSYSIGGISLDINKSSGYESLKNNAEGQFDKAMQAKKDTVLIIRGLQQPKYGMGIRSSFGPHVGSGVLSPRSFI